MKMIVSALGTALLMSAVALAQTSSGNTGSSKSSAKKASTTSSSTPSAQTGSSGASTANSGSAATQASSGFDSGLPQSDSSANAGTSGTSSAQSGSSAYGSGSGQTSSSPSSSSAMSQTGSSPSTSRTTQSGSSDEISNGPVAETVGDSSVLIGWATRNAASSTGIKYGTSRANMSETAQGTDGADGKNHHARLQGLSPSTRYYFQVTENGAPVGGVGTFKTTAAGETPVQSKAVIPQK
jgi:hypothetical protein